MVSKTFFKDNFFRFTWQGPKKAPYGELIRPYEIELDYSSDKEKKITTQIECYVSGSYVSSLKDGKVFTIRERYIITVTYSNSTIGEAMERARNMIIQKFNAENPTFSINDVFVPQLYPKKLGYEPIYTYRGGKIFRYQTRVEQGKARLGMEKTFYKNRASEIIHKYGLKRREGNIRM